MPPGSTDHDSLAEKYAKVLGMVLGLAEELDDGRSYRSKERLVESRPFSSCNTCASGKFDALCQDQANLAEGS